MKEKKRMKIKIRKEIKWLPEHGKYQAKASIGIPEDRNGDFPDDLCHINKSVFGLLLHKSSMNTMVTKKDGFYWLSTTVEEDDDSDADYLIEERINEAVDVLRSVLRYNEIRVRSDREEEMDIFL